MLSPYSTPTDLEPLAAVWEPKKGSGRNGLKTKTMMWGRQISCFKKENGKLSKNCASKDNVSKCTESPGVVAIRKNEMTFLYTQSNLIGV